MIRKLKKTDIDQVAAIWLHTNIKAHDFIPARYWQSHFDEVRSMILQAEVYVYENENEIQGFIGLRDEYIAGIFVCDKVQSQRIGRLLLKYVKSFKKSLRLSVYQKNIRAIRFYQREGFEIQHESMDVDTGEKEYIMLWQREAEI